LFWWNGASPEGDKKSLASTPLTLNSKRAQHHIDPNKKRVSIEYPNSKATEETQLHTPK
jgi:hypothetical protein